MKYNKGKQHRHSLRLKDFDYTRAGAYFITICTRHRRPFFGNVIDSAIELNTFGRVVEREWLRTEDVRENIEMDEYVIMPNHIHGILFIVNNVGATRWVAPINTPKGPKPGSLGAIMAQFKSIVTKQIRRIGMVDFQWQRNYYEHVIRNAKELKGIREYIKNNPLRWQFDKENPFGQPDEKEEKFWANFT